MGAIWLLMEAFKCERRPQRNYLWIGQNCCPTDWKAYHKGHVISKVQNASDLMTNAHAEVDIKQLMELHIAIEKVMRIRTFSIFIIG